MKTFLKYLFGSVIAFALIILMLGCTKCPSAPISNSNNELELTNIPQPGNTEVLIEYLHKNGKWHQVDSCAHSTPPCNLKAIYFSHINNTGKNIVILVKNRTTQEKDTLEFIADGSGCIPCPLNYYKNVDFIIIEAPNVDKISLLLDLNAQPPYTQSTLVTFTLNEEWVTIDEDSVAFGKINYIIFQCYNIDPEKGIIHIIANSDTLYTIYASETCWIPSQHTIDIETGKLNVVTESGLIPEGATVRIYIKDLQ